METQHSAPTYNALHPIPEDFAAEGEAEAGEKGDEYYFEDQEDDEHELHHEHHVHGVKKEVLESFDFTDAESTMWKKVSTSHTNNMYSIHLVTSSILIPSICFLLLASIQEIFSG